ncbi:DUF6519 domain-containing protein [Cryptosporangium aurantiacum]|uniref:Right handed beta helix region n=1 Tax=Cryptosporangium aurantiacum TaxID=134849 RepID=A0A1M7P9R5_9ACTN|nr:DUF6519 domain-containing protein [Cryptosporangium aurantiacum]SHN13494.1 hypothetical protein SAMN05443668_10399 [Cryptosporangium aurantiacum]
MVNGDLSRGHEPDRKRGREYRRVLLEMGSPVLDSDVASLVDAVLGETRTVARGLGTAAGSPDLGFLVTPGRLLIVFAEALDGLRVAQGNPKVCLDYRHRFADRYPALQVTSSGQDAVVQIPLLQPADNRPGFRLALWARVEEPVTIRVNGVAVSLAPASPDAPVRVEFAPGSGGFQDLDIGLPARKTVWLYLLEQDEDAETRPTFWVAPGSYQVDGLFVSASGGGQFPFASFPVGAGFRWDGAPVLDGLVAPSGLAVGDRIAAYLEVWERHVTAVEDPGLREEALGSDTASRTQLVGQVKIAPVAPGLTPADVGAAFGEPVASNGTVTIDVPPATQVTDPCALPDLAGYSGADNRLYRIEVHRGGPLASALFKWSRDNGSELFAARLDDDGSFLFDAGAPLSAGDVVEVLSSVVDLGDSALGSVSVDGFVPAERAVGQLGQLAAIRSGADGGDVAFRLADLDDPARTVALDRRYGDPDVAVLKVRRWHGTLEPDGAGPHVLEDGLTVTLSHGGTYRSGQWWQYEARVRGENANGPWRPDPHGPERRFAPLALLEFTGPTQPLRLLSWLDERFPRPDDVDADDVDFDGGRVGSASDTVQEALDELFERPPLVVDSSCGEIIIRPEHDLQERFDTIPAGGSARLCIHPGTWQLDRTVQVSGKGDLILTGAGSATRLVAGDFAIALQFTGCGTVRLQDLAIAGGPGNLDGSGRPGALTVTSCAGLDLERVTVSTAQAPARVTTAVSFQTTAVAPAAPAVRVRDCRIEVGHADTGLLLVGAATADLTGNDVVCPSEPFKLLESLADRPRGRIARLLLDDIVLGETDEANDNLLVGGNEAIGEVEPAGGRRRFIAHRTSWGNKWITFSTALPLDSEHWRRVLDTNPMPGDWSQSEAPDGFLRANLHRLRRKLVPALFDTSNQTLPGELRNQLAVLADQVVRRNSRTAGAQGIVIGGLATRIDPRFPQPRVLLGDARPELRIVGNRVTGFVQGIHVGASGSGGRRGIAHHVVISGNVVRLRVPSLSPQRHGIFVGSVFHANLSDNLVELVWPEAPEWGELTGPLDGIRVHGTFGPLVRLRDNACIGTRRGVVAHATNFGEAKNAGWRWTVAENAHVSVVGAPTPETVNW